MTTRTLLAIDGNSLAHRAFHAYERSGMITAAGRPIYAVYGFFALLAGICDQVEPTGLVVGFDDHTGSDRKARCPQYKAQRSAKDPALYQQMDDIRALLTELGVPVIVPTGLEADDVVGSAAATAETAGWRCVIATSDRDSFGLISEHTTVLRLLSGLDNAVRMTPQALFDKYGVRPDQYLQYAALRGDTSDNLPGVAGIGEKTAAKLLSVLGTLEAALADQDAVIAAAGKAAATRLFTAAAQENLTRNLDIMAIRRDVPVDLTATLLDGDATRVAAVLHAWELPNLARRMAAALAAAPAAQTTSLDPARPRAGTGPEPAAPPTVPTPVLVSVTAGRKVARPHRLPATMR